MKTIQTNTIFKDIKTLIEQTKKNVAVSVNSALTMIYWQIGKYINDEILKNKRADYGKEVVSTLSAKLTWTHFKQIIYMEDELKREFYIGMTKLDKSNIHVAQYLTVLPDREVLHKKLQSAIQNAKNRLELKDE